VTHTLRAEINLPAVYKTPEQIAGYADRALPVLQALAGIEAAAAARIVPFTDSTRFGSDITFADGHSVNALVQLERRHAGLLPRHGHSGPQGRAFEAADGRGEKVTVVNREFVRRYLGDRPPVGLTFLWGGDSKVLYRIVGVVEGTKTMTVGEDDQPQLYEPMAQITNERRRMQFVLRSATPPALQLDAVRRALRRWIRPLRRRCPPSTRASAWRSFLARSGAVLLGSIGVLGLTLAAVGLYGMMAYSVARRIQEIGVRLALGATERDIARMVLTESVRLVGLGSLIGLATAVLVMRPLTMFLVAGLSPADPASLGAVVVVLTIAGAVRPGAPFVAHLRSIPSRPPIRIAVARAQVLLLPDNVSSGGRHAILPTCGGSIDAQYVHTFSNRSRDGGAWRSRSRRRCAHRAEDARQPSAARSGA
jgi:hypothetical protein